MLIYKRVYSVLLSKLVTTTVLAVLMVASSPAQQTNTPELTIDQAVQLALENGASVTSAKLDTAKAERDLAANRTKRLASIQLVALGGQLLTKPSITFAPGSFGSFPATGPIPATNQTISVARRPVGVLVVTASQPLSTQYRLHLMLKGLSLGVAGSREDERKKRLETVDQVRRAYYDVAKAQSQLDSYRASLPLYQESKRLAVENSRRETILQSQLLEADAQLIQTENSISEASDEISSAVEKLNDLMGRDVRTQFRVSNVAAVKVAELETEEALEARALQNRPDLKKVKLQVEQAAYDRRAKKAEYIPDVSLSFDYLKTGNFGNTLPTDITTAGLQLSWEPWDWGRKRQELAEKRIQEEQAKVSLRATERSVLLEVRSARRQVENARRQLLLAEASERAARQKLQETQEQVKRETALAKELFSVQSELASADSRHQQALTAFWSARADLKKATGEE